MKVEVDAATGTQVSFLWTDLAYVYLVQTGGYSVGMFLPHEGKRLACRLPLLDDPNVVAQALRDLLFAV